jgi:RNA polymerase sigma-70 factor (ECF subfamily)
MPQDSAATATTVDDIYRAHAPFIWRVAFARKIPAVHVPDILQETFITVLRRLSSYQEQGSIKGWLYTIADGHIKAYFRSESRRLRRMMNYARIVPDGDESCPLEDRLRRSEATQLIQQFIDGLPENLCEVFLLCGVEGMPGVEVARLLNLNVNTLYSREREARRRFHAFVEGTQVNPERKP